MVDRGYTIRDAGPDDFDAILALMPRLADYDIPSSRNPKHLWVNDARLLEEWRDRDADCLVHVAVDDDNEVVGFSIVRFAARTTESRTERTSRVAGSRETRGRKR